MKAFGRNKKKDRKNKEEEDLDQIIEALTRVVTKVFNECCPGRRIYSRSRR